jgi:hypothetical protein
MYAHCDCTLLWIIQSLPLLFLIPLPPTSYFSTAFNTHLYVVYFHRCYALQSLQYYWCSIILFSFPSFPLLHSVSSTIANMFYL